ncbi:hypothetical protein FHR93_003692 [Geodermatophilus sabuli]|nr:hypothetical protein [Geodermatophilus sabuli]
MLITSSAAISFDDRPSAIAWPYVVLRYFAFG